MVADKVAKRFGGHQRAISTIAPMNTAEVPSPSTNMPAVSSSKLVPKANSRPPATPTNRVSATVSRGP